MCLAVGCRVMGGSLPTQNCIYGTQPSFVKLNQWFLPYACALASTPGTRRKSGGLGVMLLSKACLNTTPSYGGQANPACGYSAAAPKAKFHAACD